ETVLKYLQDWGARRAQRALFVEYGRGELEVIARESGLAAEGLLALGRKVSDNSELLRRRLATRGIDAEVLVRSRPQLFAQMQAGCGGCDSKGACRWDLAQDPARGAWRRYCQNAAELDALAA